MFGLTSLSPDPLVELSQQGNVTAQELESLREEYGWDQPWIQQFGTWITNVIQGDLGTSLRTNEPAMDLILERLHVTLGIAFASVLLAAMVSIPLGTWLAQRSGSRLDVTGAAITFALLAAPTYLVAIGFQLLAVGLRDVFGHAVFSAGGGPRHFGMAELLQYYTLPIATLALVHSAAWTRYQRALVADAAEADHVGFARARGVSERQITRQHILRIALIPMISVIALDLSWMAGGSVVIETVFGLPGIGRLLVESVQARDMPVVMAVVMVTAVTILLVNALADILLEYLDPRARLRVDRSRA